LDVVGDPLGVRGVANVVIGFAGRDVSSIREWGRGVEAEADIRPEPAVGERKRQPVGVVRGIPAGHVGAHSFGEVRRCGIKVDLDKVP